MEKDSDEFGDEQMVIMLHRCLNYMVTTKKPCLHPVGKEMSIVHPATRKHFVRKSHEKRWV